MLREIAEALEALSCQRPLILVLEDIHWSDSSTVELLAYVARRRGPARLLILGTYRPAEVATRGHPLKEVVREVHGRAHCAELPLGQLSGAEVEIYLRNRFSGAALPPALPAIIHGRTEGNPLFMVVVIEQLLREGAIEQTQGQWCIREDVTALAARIPERLRPLIGQQFDNLQKEEQRLLEIASVVGTEFGAAAIAIVLAQPVEVVEELCDRLANRGQFVSESGIEEWPDGTMGGRYRFLHVLYREVIYDRIAEARRVQWHRRIAEQKAAAYGERVGEIAAELAVHCEQGRDIERAVQYLGKAGEHAVRRSAHREAVAHLTKGLAFLQTLPATSERDQQELTLQITLGASLMALKGYTAPAVERVYARAHELCGQVGETSLFSSVVSGLATFCLIRGEFETARKLGEQLLSLAQREADSALFVEAHYLLGTSLFHLGELTAAQEYLQRGIALYDPQQHMFLAFRYGQDPGVFCRCYMARLLWFLGYPDQALQQSQEALALARELAHPFSLALAFTFAAIVCQLRQEEQATYAQAEQAIALSAEQGFTFYLAMGTILRGWALAEQGRKEEGIAQLHQGLVAWQATGAQLFRPHLLALLAESYGKEEQTAEGLVVLAEALTAARRSGRRFYEAELYRLKGELTLQKLSVASSQLSVTNPQSFLPNPQSEAEAYFQKALEIARRQQAKSWELRAATSLARLWQRQGKIDKARELLDDIYGWFTEGFDTNDLQEAEALLMALGGRVERLTVTAGALQKCQVSSVKFPTPNPQLPIPNSQSLIPSTFRHDGEYWTVAFANSVCRVKDSLGMSYLVQLLRRPHQEVHVLALTSGQPVVSTETAPSTKSEEQGEFQPLLASKQRLQELQEELAEAEAFHDTGRKERLLIELETLTEALLQTAEENTRCRKAASATERTRLNVTRAIKTAIKHLADVHPSLGRRLTETIKTGILCAYLPEADTSISWQM